MKSAVNKKAETPKTDHTKTRRTWALLSSMLKMARPYWKYMALTVLSVTTLSGAQLAAPMVIRKMIRLITAGVPDLISQSVRFGVILAGIFLLMSVCQGCRIYFAHVAAWNFVSDVRIRVYKHIQGLSLDFFHNRQTGQLLSRIVNDPDSLEGLIAHVVPDMIVNCVLLTGVILLLFIIHPILAGISMIFLPFIFLSIYQYSTIVRPMFKKSQQALSELNAVVAEDLSGIREIQAFNRQEREAVRVTASSVLFSQKSIHALTKGAYYHPRIEFFNNLATAMVLACGGILAVSGKIQVADLVAFMLYLGLLQGPVAALGRLNEDFQNSMAAVERVDELLHIQTNVLEPEQPLTMGRMKGNVEFNHVGFSYTEDSDVLKDVSFSLQPGKMLAVVGPTGAGKSTIANLLMRFYDCEQGEILLDGQNIRNYRLADIRKNVSIVMQDIFLFNGTIAENIAYGTDSPTMEAIKNAARMARAEEFIFEMPQGYDTIIGERGVKLSGGQKQRISIARALLRDTPVLILDEATAAVDMHTEKKIQEAVAEVTRDRSTIVIAHRLSTIMHADEILYLDNGLVRERGTHGELLSSNGYYSSLWKQIEYDERNLQHTEDKIWEGGNVL